ncbi:helix-turn-helix transcriptional regulator [bacterium]|nr:helix-turn-helix transcriptional regulator [bacterium]
MYVVNLYNVRWKQKYTQDEIAEATGLGVNTVSHLLSGKHYDYKISTLEKIAKFFNCKIHDILIEVEDEV